MANDYPSPEALAPAQIEAKAEAVGVGKASLPLLRMFVLAMLAGLFIGLGGTFMLLVKSDANLGFAASSVVGGIVFSLGLFSVVVAGAELFTGNCLMIIGLLSGKYGISAMLRNWVVVWIGNLCGSVILALILHLANFGGLGGGAVGQAMVNVAATKAGLSWSVAFFRGVMCNILVCLGVWISFAAKSVADKFFSVTLPVAAFVACGFEHCIANMFFLPMGLLAQGAGFNVAGTDVSALNAMGILSNISASTLGNIVGGAILFGGAYWLSYGRRQKGE